MTPLVRLRVSQKKIKTHECRKETFGKRGHWQLEEDGREGRESNQDVLCIRIKLSKNAFNKMCNKN